MSFYSKLKFDLLIFLICWACISGGAFTMYRHYDFSHSPDVRSYLSMAQLDFSVDIHHRYRWIIPVSVGFISKNLKYLLPNVATRAFGSRQPYELELLLFFVCNSLLTATTLLIVFKCSLRVMPQLLAGVLAVIIFISSKWVWYIAGLPYTDSLYLLCIACMVYGIVSKNNFLVYFSILVGPMSKESYWLFVPIILFHFGFKNLPIYGILLASFLVSIGSRLYIETLVNCHDDTLGLANAIGRQSYVVFSFYRIFSAKGFFELISVFGLYPLLFVYKEYRWLMVQKIPRSLLFGFPVAILIHMFISGDLDRMLFMAAPFYCPIFGAMLLLYIQKKYKLAQYKKND